MTTPVDGQSTRPSIQADVLVIGGGVVGMALAYELSRRGTKVTVIDQGDPGFGCSYGNAGWLTPCFSMPLPMPGMLLKSIGWLLDPMSPLHIKPEPSLTLLNWLLHFLASMRVEKMQRSVTALTEISKYSLDAYAKLEGETGQSIGFERKGLLMVASSAGGVAAALEEMHLVSDRGVPGRALSEDDIRALEPALVGRLRGGVYFPAEAHAEPLQIVEALAAGARRHGATIVPRTEVFDFAMNDGRVEGVRTTQGWLHADQYVLATGSWSLDLARKLRLRVPILGGKGYAVIVKPFAPAPKIPIMIVEKKVAVTPRAGSIRLAGTLELVKQDFSITPRRVDAIVNGAREFLNVPAEPEITEVWRGLRPCTPDGVPLIGRSARWRNLFLCAGHQMLGLQSAPGSARLAADLILGATPLWDPKPFRADRF